ncbi:MAG: glycosyltransferase family 2 protein [Anaerostipes sp.]|nr:glycosyltransferase family 2 protein [Anaerostipes sp.]
MPTLTVFTPAYNRAHTIGRTYESLKSQSCKDFKWLIIDDGSNDNTRELVEAWKKQDNGFEIEYIYKENGGMHTAHNVAYEHIDTELNVCIDSDDCMANDAISKIINAWDSVRDKNYAGLIGLDADMEGNIIGNAFPKDMYETTLSNYYATGGSGDKKLVYKTEIIKKYPPYPVFEGEKYVPLSYKYLLCDQEYEMFVINDVLCNVEYQIDGSSATMWKQYLNNPNGFIVIRKLDMIYPNSLKKVLTATIHYISSSILAKKTQYVNESPRKILTVCLIPFGWLLSKYIIFKANKMEKEK